MYTAFVNIDYYLLYTGPRSLKILKKIDLSLCKQIYWHM